MSQLRSMFLYGNCFYDADYGLSLIHISFRVSVVLYTGAALSAAVVSGTASAEVDSVIYSTGGVVAAVVSFVSSPGLNSRITKNRRMIQRTGTRSFNKSYRVMVWRFCGVRRLLGEELRLLFCEEQMCIRDRSPAFCQ